MRVHADTFIGDTFQEKMTGKNKLVPRLLGVTKESIIRVDERTKAVRPLAFVS